MARTLSSSPPKDTPKMHLYLEQFLLKDNCQPSITLLHNEPARKRDCRAEGPQRAHSRLIRKSELRSLGCYSALRRADSDCGVNPGPPHDFSSRRGSWLFPSNFQKQLFSLELDKIIHRESKYLSIVLSAFSNWCY